MATATWPLENGKKKNEQRIAPRAFLALFCLFSLVFDRFCTFSLVFALFGLSVSDLSFPSVLANLRLLPFSGRQLDSPDMIIYANNIVN